MGEYTMSKGAFWALVSMFLCITALVGILCGLLPNRDNTDCMPSATQSPQTTESTEPSGPKGRWGNIRLPTNLKPHEYDLFFTIDITNKVFNGNSKVLIECIETTDIILIHSKQLQIDSVSLKHKDGGSAPGFSDPWLYAENQYLVIELDDFLEVGTMYELSIDFTGELLTDLIGLYRSSYQTENGTIKWLASTFFAPTDARKAFPCFDEPAFKATFALTIMNEEAYFALSNMPVDVTEKQPPGWVQSTFQKSVPMSTYLLCFVVSDFVSIENTTKSGVKFRVWARQEAKDSLQYALEKGSAIIDFYEDYFNISFPLPKMDMIAIPDFAAGAMENWGLITYRETALLYTEGVSSPRNKQRVCTVVSHELAHQWFGNLVTLQWWDDTWLNEGFASYVEYLGMDDVEPDWGVMEQFVVNDLQKVLGIDALQTSRPIIVDVETPDDINQQFDAISYNKGASILRMLQTFLGEATFKKGLNTYLTEYSYKNAVNTDLWRHLTEAAQDDGKDIDVKTIMDTWTLQMGFPVITVTRNYGDTITFSATQKRFLTNPDSPEQPTYPNLGYKWYVPLTITNAANADFTGTVTEWLNPDQTFDSTLTVGNDSDWLLVNVREYGYYRTNYDDDNWDLISQQLEANNTIFPESNRATFISDAFNLARGGELSQVTAFELTSYLVKERAYVPWVSVDNNLGYVDLMLSRSGAYGDFNTYMLNQVTPFFEYIGWEGRSGDDHLESLSHSLAVSMSCSFGNQYCINNATKEFATWMADPENNQINPTLRSTVYCTAIAQGTQEEWKFVYDQYQNSLDASETSTLLGSLGCSGEVWVLSSLLELSLNSSQVRPQDAVDVVEYVSQNPVGYSLVWDFFRANWDYYRSTYGNSIFAFTDLVEAVTAHFNTDFELQMLKDFMADHPDQGTGSRAFIQAVDGTNANIRWMDNYLEEVTTWLENAARA